MTDIITYDPRKRVIAFSSPAAKERYLDLQRKHAELVDSNARAILASGSEIQIAALTVCDEAVEQLGLLKADVLEGLREGIAKVLRDFAVERFPTGSAERLVVDRLSEITGELCESIEEVFAEKADTMMWHRDRYVLRKLDNKGYTQ